MTSQNDGTYKYIYWLEKVFEFQAKKYYEMSSIIEKLYVHLHIENNS